jgi:GDP-L-fucose synthase
LVDLIVKYKGFKGSIKWDPKKPDGQPRRVLDISKARKEFGFVARTPLEEGILRTISWYRKELAKSS